MKATLKVKQFETRMIPMVKANPRLVALAKRGDLPGLSIEGDGQFVAVDWVEYCHPGEDHKASTPAPIYSICALRDFDPENSDHEAGKQAHARKLAIMPSYEAWKRGQKMPERGTPFAAWPGISPKAAEQLVMAGLNCVEDFAGAADSVITKIPVPSIRNLKEQARLFLASADQNKAAAIVEKMKDEQEGLKAQNAELQDQIAEMHKAMLEMKAMIEKDEGKPAKKAKAEAVAA